MFANPPRKCIDSVFYRVTCLVFRFHRADGVPPTFPKFSFYLAYLASENHLDSTTHDLDPRHGTVSNAAFPLDNRATSARTRFPLDNQRRLPDVPWRLKRGSDLVPEPRARLEPPSRYSSVLPFCLLITNLVANIFAKQTCTPTAERIKID